MSYSRSARYYDRIYAWKDYRAEADALHELIQRHKPGARTLLDVACGTGRHLENLRDRYAIEGLDVTPELLEIARERLPGTELHEGDMTTFELGREFDVVTCLFSAIGYASTTERLGATVANLARHTAPGGLVVVEPWFWPDQYRWDEVHATFVDDEDLKLARVNTSGPHGGVSVLEFHFVVGTPAGVETFTERHEVGLFTHEQYLAAFADAPLVARHDPDGLMGRGLYVGERPR
ncbi:MAG: methyltransferase domain-containing protein [Actinobacteria bacterium]|nr:methyltransferase domain-containing protein [Actinomycetota bacterium]